MFEGLSLPANLLLFAIGAGVIWWTGTRLERLTDTIARRTGMGGALGGLVMLAAATSLPEVATTVSAVIAGNTDLAVHNLLGGVGFQVVVLAIADLFARQGPVTRFAPRFGLLMEGVGLVFMLGLAIGGLALGGKAQSAVSLGPVSIGLNPVMLALPVAYGAVVWVTKRAEGRPRWRPVEPAPQATEDDGDTGGRADRRSQTRLWWWFAGFATVVLLAGWALATIADVLARQTGLGSGFVGATLLAAATSLPEVSTTIAAVRDGNEEMAVSNIFGSNCFIVGLLALVSVMAADAFSGGPPTPPIFTATLGTVLTCVYLWGLLEHSDRSVARMGIDSLVVVPLYLAGLGALYGLG